MSLLSIRAIEVRAPDGRLLLSPQDFTVGPGLTGLVGANGVGKSTLLRVLAGEEVPEAGRVVGPRPRLLDPRRTPPAEWGVPASASPGERARAWLSWAMATASDAWLIDEPSAHLDADGRERLSAWLRRLTVPVVVASHDRRLLRDADAIVELSPWGLQAYGGGFEDYLVQREAERARDQAQLERERRQLRQERLHAQRSRERAEQRASRGEAGVRKGSQGAMLQGFLRGRAERAGGARERAAADRVEAARARRDQTLARMDLRPQFQLRIGGAAVAPGQRVLDARGLAIHAGDRPLVRDLDWRLIGPARWAVQGANGAGKSRLLRVLAGIESPQAGEVRRAPLPMALVDQAGRGLQLERTVLDNLRSAQPVSEAEARECLAWFLFRGDEVFRPAGSLSAGETMRLALACQLGGPQAPALLLLDEPDNHLDLPSLAVVERALAQYRGALVVVSHDPDFLAAVGVTDWMRLSGGAPRLSGEETP